MFFVQRHEYDVHLTKNKSHLDQALHDSNVFFEKKKNSCNEDHKKIINEHAHMHFKLTHFVRH